MVAITKEEVFEIATALMQTGEKPTSISVRERLGTGSYTTIAGYLREWKANRKSLESVQSEEIPLEIREVGTQFTRVVWGAATDWLNRELATAKKVASEQVEEAEAQAQEAMVALESLERERDKLVTLKDELSARWEELHSKNSTLEGSVSELREELQRERERNHTLSDRVTVETARSAALEERVQQREQRSQELETELQSLRNELQALRQTHEQLSRQGDSLHIEKSSLEAKTIDLHQELDRERVRTAEMNERYQVLSERLIELTATQRHLKSDHG